MTTSTTHSVEELLGLSGLEGRERDDMLERIGTLVMESVFLRVVAGLSDAESLAFGEFADTNPSPEVMYEYLEKIVPEIEDIWKEEVEAFRGECIAVLERQGTLIPSAAISV